MSEQAISEGAELAGGFSRRTVAGLAIAAALSFVIALLLSLLGRDLSRPPTPEASSFSHGALGHRALADFLADLGLGVVSRETRAGFGTGPEYPLVLIEPDPERIAADSTRRLEALLAEARRKGAPLVLVLPKWQARPLPDHPGWVGALELVPVTKALLPLGRLLSGSDPRAVGLRRVHPGEPLDCYAFWGEGERLDVQLTPAQLLSEGPHLEALLRCRGGVLVGRTRLDPDRQDSPEFLVVADPDLLNNQGLARGDHAVVAYRLAEHLGASGFVLDETIHGFERASGLFAEVFRFPLILVLLAMLLLVGVVIWAGAVRFGKPLPAGAALPPGKDVLLDNTARLLALGGVAHAADSLGRYYRQSLRAVAARLFVPTGGGERDVRERLQRLSDARGLGVDLATLERHVREAEATVPHLARDIHRWRQEMTDAA